MANFKKVFNFREGVQVDDQTFVVNGSLVGIGTSVPEKFLDVRRDATFTGLTTFTEVVISAGATFETGITSVQIGRFAFNDGIVSAATGVVTFLGDGSQLSDLPTSQWVDVDTGIGVSSVYNGGNVGIATLVPRFQLQIGGDPEPPTSADGVGIRQGNIYMSGVVTATRYYGDAANLTNLNADELTAGIVTQARIPRLELDKIPLIPDYKLEQNLQISGILTAGGGFIGSLVGDVEGNVIANSGFSTFNDGEFKGTLTAVASTARTLTGTPDIRVGFVSANIIDAGIALTVNRANMTGDVSVGILTVTGESLRVGTSGSIFNVTGGAIGIGTTLPQSTLVLYQQEGTNLEILTETGAATLNLGGDLGIGQSTAELRQEDLRFELSNYSNGDYIYHLGRELSVGSVNGSFRWLKGDPVNEMMTLTKDGNLGLGITAPGKKLVVTGDTDLDGTLLVTGKTEIDDAVIIYGNLTYNALSGVATAYDLDISRNLNVTSDIIASGIATFPNVGFLVQNAGVSTFPTLDVSGGLGVAGIATFGTLVIPDNTNMFTNSGVSTFANLRVIGDLSLDGNTFNYETTTGITTVNNFSVSGFVTFAEAPNFNLNVSDGISTFQGLDVQGALSIGGTATFTSAVIDDLVFTNTLGITTIRSIDVDTDVNVGGALTVVGATEFQGAVVLPTDVEFNFVSGISTFFDLDVTNNLYAGGISSIREINTDITFSGSTQQIGTGLTISNDGGQIDLASVIMFSDVSGKIGFNTDSPSAAVDVGMRTDTSIIFPRMTTTQRNALGDQAVEGSVIYNTSTNAHQGFNGSSWTSLNYQPPASPGWTALETYTTAGRNALSGMPTGAIIYNTTLSQVEVYTGVAWTAV